MQTENKSWRTDIRSVWSDEETVTFFWSIHKTNGIFPFSTLVWTVWGLTVTSCHLFFCNGLAAPDRIISASCLSRWTNYKYLHNSTGWKCIFIHIFFRTFSGYLVKICAVFGCKLSYCFVVILTKCPKSFTRWTPLCWETFRDIYWWCSDGDLVVVFFLQTIQRIISHCENELHWTSFLSPPMSAYLHRELQCTAECERMP